MLTATLLFAILIGLAGWMPAPVAAQGSWLGFRFFHAGMGLIVALYTGNVILGIPLTWLALVIGAVAAAGIVATLVRMRSDLQRATAELLHPVWFLAFLVATVAAVRGGVSYLPYPGDEVASWLRLARQIFLVDAYWSERVDYHHGGYPNGWPLLAAFANTLGRSWDDGHAALVPFLLHLGVLGLTFDVLRNGSEKALGSSYSSMLLTWLGVLALLTAEASWILVPRFLLIDEPLTYAFIGAFLTAILLLMSESSDSRMSAMIGLTLAAAFLLKIAVLALVPAILVIILAAAILYRWSFRRIVQDAAWILIPLTLVILTWSYFKAAEECNASPLLLLSGSGAPSFERLRFVGDLYVAAFLDYVPHYKWAISIAALFCLAIGLFHQRLMWIVAGLAVFIGTYSTALYFSYVSCLDIIDSVELQSFQRYFLVNLRILHVVGPVVFALWAFDNARMRAAIRVVGEARGARAAALAAVILLLGYQGWMVDRSLNDLATRELQDHKIRDAIVRMKGEAIQLRAVITQRGLIQPRVSLIDQGGYGVEFDLGAYFGIKDHRDGGSNFLYVPVPPYSWSEQKFNFATAVSDRSRLVDWWNGFDIVWPVNMDSFARSALEELVSDPVCRAAPEKYFLVRSAAGIFECVPKFN